MAAAISMYRRLSRKLLKSSYASSFSLSSTPNPQILIPKPLSFFSPTFPPKPTNFNPTFDRSSSSFYGSIREKPRFFSTDSGSSSSEKPSPNPSQNPNSKLTAGLKLSSLINQIKLSFVKVYRSSIAIHSNLSQNPNLKLIVEQELLPLMNQSELFFMKLYRSTAAVALLGLANFILSHDPDSSWIHDPNFLPFWIGLYVAFLVRMSASLAKAPIILLLLVVHAPLKFAFFLYSSGIGSTIFELPTVVTTGVVVNRIVLLGLAFIMTLSLKRSFKFLRDATRLF